MLIKSQCKDAGVPLFMKESIRDLMVKTSFKSFLEGLKT